MNYYNYERNSNMFTTINCCNLISKEVQPIQQQIPIQPWIFLFFKNKSYNYKNIYKQWIKKWKGIYDEIYILFYKTQMQK